MQQKPHLRPNASQLPPAPRKPPMDLDQLAKTIQRECTGLWVIGLLILIHLMVITWVFFP